MEDTALNSSTNVWNDGIMVFDARWLFQWTISLVFLFIGNLVRRECKKVRIVFVFGGFRNPKFSKATSLNSFEKVSIKFLLSFVGVSAKVIYCIWIKFFATHWRNVSQCDCDSQWHSSETVPVSYQQQLKLLNSGQQIKLLLRMPRFWARLLQLTNFGGKAYQEIQCSGTFRSGVTVPANWDVLTKNSKLKMVNTWHHA